ncbi:MAG: tetratricopeptide (TPR) repeat protein [Chitinophagales bacterium]|jgi:tetratricopeptide (TPR) repeat protein
MADQNSHINPSDVENYFSKGLSDEEKKDFENGLESDSFESEALEGFNSLGDDAAAIAAIREIKGKVAKQTGLKNEGGVVFPIWKSLGIAATVALFVLSGFFVHRFMEKEPTVAKNETNSVPIFEPEGLNDIAQSVDADSSLIEDIEKEDIEKEEIVLVPNEQLAKMDEAEVDELEEIDLVSEDFETVTIVEDFPEPEEDNYYNNTVEKEVADLGESEDSYVPPAPATIASVDKRTSANKSISSKLDTVAEAQTSVPSPSSNSYYSIGKTNYDVKNYSAAIDYFQSSLDNNERKVESQYYIAMCYNNMNKENKAIKYFDMVLANNSSMLRYNAMWYKAIILEEKGDMKGAKALMENLANSGSGFKNQAADKLKNFN